VNNQVGTGAGDFAVVLLHTCPVTEFVVPVQVNDAEVLGDAEAGLFQPLAHEGLVGDDDVRLGVFYPGQQGLGVVALQGEGGQAVGGVDRFDQGGRAARGIGDPTIVGVSSATDATERESNGQPWFSKRNRTARWTRSPKGWKSRRRRTSSA